MQADVVAGSVCHARKRTCVVLRQTAVAATCLTWYCVPVVTEVLKKQNWLGTRGVNNAWSHRHDHIMREKCESLTHVYTSTSGGKNAIPKHMCILICRGQAARASCCSSSQRLLWMGTTKQRGAGLLSEKKVSGFAMTLGHY